MERLQAMANLAMRPVIVISASEPVEAERQARAAGAVAFFYGFVETVRGQL